ncbi:MULTISPECIES: hypothetical protein [Vibrio]|uniref:hypothetical protein n=1 Tax=Vibrio TaxID=662 RepID=UPI0029646B74|nr:hypothetical protein [Vibrio sp. Vb0562]MDW1953261.1 hypothetical protein [Vibrio sp. Vb0562]
MPKSIVFFISILFAFSTSASSADSTPSTEPVAEKGIPTSTNNNHKDTNRIDKKVILLERQLSERKIENELLKSHQDNLLSTVLWALGFCGSVILVIVTLGWWSNTKMHQKDVEAIEQRTSKRLSDFGDKLRKEVNQSLSEKEASYQNQYKLLFDHMNSKSEDLTREINSLEGKLDEKSKELSELTSEVSELMQVIVKLQYSHERELRWVESKIWEIKEIPQNVLSCMVSCISSDISLDNKDGIKYQIERIIPVLRDCVATNVTIGKFLDRKLKNTVKELDAYSDIVPMEFYDLVERLQVDKSPE